MVYKTCAPNLYNNRTDDSPTGPRKAHLQEVQMPQNLVAQ